MSVLVETLPDVEVVEDLSDDPELAYYVWLHEYQCELRRVTMPISVQDAAEHLARPGLVDLKKIFCFGKAEIEHGAKSIVEYSQVQGGWKPFYILGFGVGGDMMHLFDYGWIAVVGKQAGDARCFHELPSGMQFMVTKGFLDRLHEKALIF